MMMRKILWMVLVVLLIFTSLLSYTYVQAIQPLKKLEKEATSIALRETGIVTVDGFEAFNGLDTIWVVKGKNNKGESLIVWISEKDKKITIKRENEGLSSKAAIKKVKELSKPKKILDVRLGMEKGIPLWEIYYLSDDDLINYYHIDFETGEWIKKIENL
ncbi:cell wall elongation regulator TseB-like domain-containing protein [Pseudoneobacillus sp. C159]